MDRAHRRISIAIGLVAVALLLAACSSGGSATATPAVPTVAPASVAPASAAPASPAGGGGGGGGAVTIQNFAFGPTSVTIKAGDTVTWTNKDTTQHTVTADDGSFDSKGVASGATFSQTFATAGTFTYHCSIHPTMKATVIVQ